MLQNLLLGLSGNCTALRIGLVVIKYWNACSVSFPKILSTFTECVQFVCKSNTLSNELMVLTARHLSLLVLFRKPCVRSYVNLFFWCEYVQNNLKHSCGLIAIVLSRLRSLQFQQQAIAELLREYYSVLSPLFTVILSVTFTIFLPLGNTRWYFLKWSNMVAFIWKRLTLVEP